MATRIELGSESQAYDADDRKVEYRYDYMSRRARKTAFTHDGSDWVEDGDWLFIYDDWTLDTPRLAVRDSEPASPAVAGQG